MEFVVAPAGAQDMPDWVRMRCALWPDAGADGHAAELRSFAADEGFVAFLARRRDGRAGGGPGGAAVGFAEASLRPYANGCLGRPVPFLEGIWVEPAARRHGVGRGLLAAVEGWARGRGFAELGSDAALANVLSHRTHAAWGFAETERVVYFRKRLAEPGAE